MEKRWQVYPQVSKDLKQQILQNRKIESRELQEHFLHPLLTKFTDVHKLFPSIHKVINRIKKAITEKELIYIYGDYDVDGITASAILWETLDLLGAKVMPYIPSRHTEGYGLNNDALAAISKEGAKVVISVDCGITAIDQAKFAKKLKLDLIITDHHQPQAVLPDSFATLHTIMLAGSGVAMKLANCLLEEFGKGESDQIFKNLELATLGTVADMVPLIGDNRIIVKNGLLGLAKTQRLGLKSLYNQAGIGKDVGTYEIGFIISPRLNAMGRMESAFDSLRLLLTRDPARAEKLALKLGEVNKLRQDSTASALEHAKSEVEKKYLGSKLFVISSEDYEEGVVGLVAGRITESYHRPTAVISENSKVSKGSARSITGFNITQAIGKNSDLLISHGGHPMAAGFSIEAANIQKFRENMAKIAEVELTDEDLIAQLKIDAEIEINEVDENLSELLKEFEPFGIGNPEPLFLTKNLEVVSVRTVGKENNHLKLTLKDNEGRILEAVGFGLADKKPNEGEMVDVVYNVRENFWNSRKRIEGRIKDLRKAEK